jgi:hypothetical protein
MKTTMRMIGKIGICFALAAVLAFAVRVFGGGTQLVRAAHGAEAEEDGGRSPLGSWLFTITPPLGGPPAFNTLASFARGGVFVGSTQLDHREPEAVVSSAGPQQGAWRRTGDNEFSSTQLAFLYDQDGNPVGIEKVRFTFSLTDSNDLTGQGQLLQCDLNGDNCVSLPGCAAIQGKRIAVEPPQCQ